MADVQPRRRGRRFLVLGISLALSLVAGELLARNLIGVPLHERLPLLMVRANAMRGWEMVPGLSHYTYHHRVQVNALGLRGPELAPKAAGERRILFLGDSLTYGQGVGDDETVPHALEAALRARDPGRVWTVVNAGHRSYGTQQELGLLDELGAAIQPDVVLLGWYWNDLSERAVPEIYADLKDRGEIVFDLDSPPEGWHRLLWHLAQVPRSSALVMWLYDLVSSKGTVFEPTVVEHGIQLLGRQLERLRELAARSEAEPVMVIFPDRSRLLGRGETWSMEQAAAGLARERGVPVVELLPALQTLFAGSAHPPILPFDGHYDARASRAMGEYMAERLLALGVPQRTE